jgi:hypothetical protein
MAQYAMTKDPGIGTVFKYDKNWDANKLFRCQCDYPFYGPDCSYQTCPTGDDPLTGSILNPTPTNPSQYNEIQRVSCTASRGFFTLTFKGYTTRQIPFNARQTEISNALTALPSINGVKIVMYGAQACLAQGSAFTIEFTQDFGLQPLLIVTDNVDNGNLAKQLVVTRQQPGSKENIICSGRGVCDALTGICGCTINYDSSNGYNQFGTRGDCGYAIQVKCFNYNELYLYAYCYYF